MKDYIKYRKACRRVKRQEKEIERQIQEIEAKDRYWAEGLDPVEAEIIEEFAKLKVFKPKTPLSSLRRKRYRK